MGTKVLLRLPNWVGDVVMVTPSIIALTKKGFEVSLAIREHLYPLIKDFPAVDKIYKIKMRSLSSNFIFLNEVRKENFDFYIVFAKGFREGLLSKLSKSKRRVGYDVNKRGLFFTDKVNMSDQLWDNHHVFQFAELLRPLKVELTDEKVFLPVSEQDEKNVSDLLSREGLKEKEFIVFHIGSSKFPRAYHSERFGKCADEIMKEYSIKIALIGDKNDKEYIDSFMNECKDAVNLLGKTKLRELPSLLSKAKLFVGNDSGPMHIASAVKTKVVAVFGPGSPNKTSPFMDETLFRIVYQNFPCSPCRQRFFKECKPSINGKPFCLESIDYKTVKERIIELLD